MSPQLSTQPIIPRKALVEIAESRLREATTLLEAGHYAAAIYLAGFAVECYLKTAICVALHWDDLRATFKTHDLECLMLHSGLDPELRANPRLSESFSKIVETWSLQSRNTIRYRCPSDFNEEAARSFLEQVSDPVTGVVPWLRKATS